MLLEEIINDIDARWKNCWPISSLKPFAVLDLISYLFFVKKLDDVDFKGKRIPELSAEASFYDDDLMEFSWEKLKDMDAKNMHLLFTKQNGIIDLMSYYSGLGLPYSDCFKVLPAVTPTAQLLSNTVAIVDIIESANKTMRVAIANYLFNKSEITGESGQADIPEHLARILVAVMRPTSSDVVWDPLAGNARLLINSARYINNSNAIAEREIATQIGCGNISGMETDLIHFRIGNMNMILNGIVNPGLEILDISQSDNIALVNKPSLIISNLYFTGAEPKMAVDEQSLFTENIRKEIIFLNLILQNLKRGARAAVIVPDAILYSNQLPIKKIREEIVENCILEAVISLPARKDMLFSGGAMLIISKHEISTSSVWFYKLPLLPEVSGEIFTDVVHDSFNIAEQYTTDTILKHLKNKNTANDLSDDNHFYITVEQLRANGHNFNYNQYGLILKRSLAPNETLLMPPGGTEIALPEENIINEEHFAKEIPAVKKSVVKKVMLAIVLIMAIGGALGFYFVKIWKPVTSKPRDGIFSDTSRNTSSADSIKLQADTKDVTATHYIVISKAYFYSEPNETSRESGYLTHRTRGKLIAGEEKNDFVYVTFDNQRGRIIKGWLNKKDLKVAK
ncbi:MAG TPA: N-6 DNA methylase [Ginsengibacter sp.]